MEQLNWRQNSGWMRRSARCALVTTTQQPNLILSLVLPRTYTHTGCELWLRLFVIWTHSIRMAEFIICSKMNYFPKNAVVLLLFGCFFQHSEWVLCFQFDWLNRNRLYHFLFGRVFHIFSTRTMEPRTTVASRCVDSLQTNCVSTIIPQNTHKMQTRVDFIVGKMCTNTHKQEKSESESERVRRYP